MNKSVTCKICYICDNTGLNGDMDSDIHKGFTIGKGKQLYWMRVWSRSGNVSVFTTNNNKELMRKRWIRGDTLITIHWK